MLNVVEFSLREPVAVYPFFHLPWHLNGATARVFEAGDAMDITDARLPNQTHQWHLRVRRDGVGVLTIRPNTERSSVLIASRSQCPERVREITHILNHTSTHLLMGMDQRRFRPVVFKAVCALPQDHTLMQWIMNSGPQRM